MAALQSALQGKGKHAEEYRVPQEDGSIRWVAVEGTLMSEKRGENARLLGITRDITERKQAEEALQESREVLHAVLNAIPVRVFWKDKNLVFLGCNTQFARDAGFEKPEEIIGKDDFAMGWRDQAELYRADDRLVIEGGETKLLFEEPQTTPSGELLYLLTSKLPLRDAAGEIVGVLGTYYDITAHRKAERDYRMLFCEMLDGFALHEIICDQQGKPVDYRFLAVNPAFESMTGLKAKDIVGRNVLEVLPGIERHWIETYGTVALTGRPANFENYSAELRKHFDVTAFQPVPNQFACIFVDVTETKRLREQEFRAQRLETAGQVAGQVAHDLNNLLTPLLAYPDLIRETLPDNHPSLVLLNAIQRAAGRIAEINQQLLTLGRRGHFKQDVLNLNSIIGQVIESLGPLPDTLDCVTDLDPHLKNIRGGSAQLYRVIMNLLMNALDAVTQDGMITIKSENCSLEQALCAYTRVPAGDYVKITVTDNGCGIRDQVVQRIFDPFFTTKSADQSRGSGMGLSVVDAVIKDHGGYVDLQTRVGHGTSFFLYLPVSDDTVSEQPQAEIPRGCETVLVVDDDEMQREVFVRLLTGLGYQVTAAGSGEEALELLTHVSQDILILDLVMPGGIDGIETFRRALLINPYQAVIIVTGCVESGNTREARDLWGCTVLSKPVDRKTLSLAVRKQLESTAEELRARSLEHELTPG
jgi:PAS domain S-box-containing protein